MSRPARPPAETAPARERIDKWLWRARVSKTRGLAAKLVAGGHVRLNGKRIDDPGRGLRVGDVLTIATDKDVRVVRVVDFGLRRGPATEAQGLYETLTPERAER